VEDVALTLVLVLKWVFKDREGVVVSSDSKVTLGPVSFETRKVYPIVLRVDGDYVPLAIAGGAGDATLIKQSYRICEKILQDLAIREWGRKTPSFEQFEEAVRQIESALISRFRGLREQGLEPDFSMILASVDVGGKASIYQFDDRGLAEPVHDNPGFAVIGKGFYTGGNLLLKLLDYTPERSGELDLGALSAFIVDVVSEIDPSVGPFIGESYYMRLEEGEVVLGPLTEEALKEYKEKVKQRKEILKLLWKLFDHIEEQKIMEKIKELEEAEEHHRNN
jgi:20S proteasome alpha/beta subunit